MDDPLKLAEIEVIAVDGPIEVAGLTSGATVELPPKKGMILPSETSPEPTPVIFTPPPLKPGIRAFRTVDSEIEPAPEAEISLLPADDPLVYSITEAARVDLRHFRAVAAQAASQDRRLVIVAYGKRNG